MNKRLAAAGAGLALLLLAGCASAPAPAPAETLEPIIPMAEPTKEDVYFYDILELAAPITLSTQELRTGSKAMALSSCNLLDTYGGTIEQVMIHVRADGQFEHEKTMIVAAGINAYCPQHLPELTEWKNAQ